jgi:hypothetical protein
MRILLALTLFAFACGGSKPKQESSMVSEGSDQSPSCCCKTLPTTAEKEIIPNYENRGRMECSSANGDCVDDVQCAGKEPAPASETTQPSGQGADGVPPPPVLQPSTSSTP